MKGIYTKLSQFYEAKIAGCSCGGSGQLDCNDYFPSESDDDGCGYGWCEMRCTKRSDCNEEGLLTCPTCSPLIERLKGLCSIKCNGHPMKTRCSCKYEKDGCYVPLKDNDGEPHIGGTDLVTLRNTPRSAPYPDLTTHLTGSKPTVRVLLEEAGLWERFDLWIIEHTFLAKLENIFGTWTEKKTLLDVITDLTLLCQAVDNFLQEVNK